MTKKDYINGLVLTNSELNAKATLLTIISESAEGYSTCLDSAINDLGDSASDEAYRANINTGLTTQLGLS